MGGMGMEEWGVGLWAGSSHVASCFEETGKMTEESLSTDKILTLLCQNPGVCAI